MSNYIAKPAIVNARRITGFEPVEVRGTLDLIGNAGLWLHLDDDTKYKAAPSQLGLFMPQEGDVLVCDVDFEFILPKVVFERNFWPADEFKLDAVAKAQSALSAAQANPVEVAQAVAGSPVEVATAQAGRPIVNEIADAFTQIV